MYPAVARTYRIPLLRKDAPSNRVARHDMARDTARHGRCITIFTLLVDLATFFRLALCPQGALAAENRFLRKQLAMFQERKARPHRSDTRIRIALVLLYSLFNRRDALVDVQPQTVFRWHRQGFRLFWRWKSRPGRPLIPVEPRQLTREMAIRNPSWGEASSPEFVAMYVTVQTVFAHATSI